ncbi:class I SAM-dependent methyltransferase [Enterococcus massiliensis]|uniref:class I SAM-dependent methyltransferase n=1 Tax=Enterococcus massiliensis TaxID=1640685 RepID=UPI00065E4440|nr:class I SAM-dependent methyltransferase [Enterococcus massiliensis]
MPKILDACCGSRMFWYDKSNPDVTFMDIRQHYEELKTGHIINVNPDVVADFTDMPFPDGEFDLVVFDPPHLIHAGDNSWLVKKYGKLNQYWPTLIHDGFEECMRVLKPNGTLVFKWNEEQISFRKVLNSIDYKPLFGDKRAKTRRTVFMK